MRTRKAKEIHSLNNKTLVLWPIYENYMFREIPNVSDLLKVCVSLVVVMPHPYNSS
jgi:hypothetical protein